MNKSEQRAKKVSAAIAGARKNLSQQFTIVELLRRLKEEKCPYISYVPTILIKEKLIKRVAKATFVFSYSTPVTFYALQKDLDTAYSSIIASQKPKAIVKKVEESNSGIHSPIELGAKIKELKSYGYKILVPTNWELI